MEGAEGSGDGYKLYYVEEISGRNNMGILLSPGMKEGVMKVNR